MYDIAYECKIYNSLTFSVFFLFLSSLCFRHRNFVSNICFFSIHFFLICNVMRSMGVMWLYLLVYLGIANRILGRLVLAISFFFFYSLFNIWFILCSGMCMTCWLSMTSMFRSSALVFSLFIYEIIIKNQNYTLLYLNFCVRSSVHKVRI